jgi:hypothetical protein
MRTLGDASSASISLIDYYTYFGIWVSRKCRETQGRGVGDKRYSNDDGILSNNVD